MSDNPANTMAEALVALSAAFEPVIEATAGHRAKLEAAGFSPTAAEAMAEQFYRVLLHSLTTQIGS